MEGKSGLRTADRRSWVRPEIPAESVGIQSQIYGDGGREGLRSLRYSEAISQREKSTTMQLNQEQMEAVAAILSGTAINGNGKARRVNGKKRNSLQPISAADLLKGNPARESSADEIPDTAQTAEVEGREYHVYPAQFEGIKGVKCTFMPFKKQFLSLNTLRLLANPEIQALITTFVQSVDGE